MHEHIKYSVVLDEQIKETRSIDNIETGEPRDAASDWQSIFADHKYHTHHFIYAKFIGQKDGVNFKVSKVQFYLQNYKGCTSIGFNGHFKIDTGNIITSPDPDYYPERYSERKKFHLSIGLQALKGDLSDRVKLDYDLDTVSEFLISDGDVLVTETIYTPADPEITKIYQGAEAMKKAVFVDDLFMERWGEDVIVSNDGYARLSKLNRDLPDLVSDAQFSAIIDPQDEHLTKVNELTEIGIKGILYPCIPINSIFSIK